MSDGPGGQRGRATRGAVSSCEAAAGFESETALRWLTLSRCREKGPRELLRRRRVSVGAVVCLVGVVGSRVIFVFTLSKGLLPLAGTVAIDCASGCGAAPSALRSS